MEEHFPSMCENLASNPSPAVKICSAIYHGGKCKDFQENSKKKKY
jgi:hypothetical protein